MFKFVKLLLKKYCLSCLFVYIVSMTLSSLFK